ncbi:flagellar hook-basal body complex protein FliE [Microbacterium sp. XT11]|uniref:flagellar hook-basal body complex protein FliE n=1 Tax=Microbacterium sp. XT11 TaxID=367477 RepID=UPI000742EB4F|nr:flagellar hook-basal body complex protein FliE [Microbacterium sp. XT11]ALX67038.1 hypothetical protein AB663_002667 [Microbacterium sp. XT11]
MAAAIGPVPPTGVGGLTPLSFESDASPSTTGAAAFGSSLTGAVEELQRLQSTSNELAVQAVTGDLQDIHKAMIASARASVTLDLMVAVRDRGVSAFTEIMRMQA